MVFVRVPVNAKGQIVIPKIFRQLFGIRPDSTVVLEDTDSAILIRPAKSKEELMALFDSFPKRHIGKIDSDKDYAEELESRWTT
jgi:AbrB family looped-hinge helix DNA binding protein